MENILERVPVVKQEMFLPESYIRSHRTSIFSTIYLTMRKLFVLFMGFIEYHPFYEDEYTDTSPFSVRIEIINRLNNK